MRTKFSGFLTLLLVFIVQLGFAQEKTITGTVTDPDGLPLPGATVQIKSTGSGTQTDFDGNFSIQATADDVLIISYVGMKTQEVKVGSQSSVSVSLKIDASELDEVVVVGYNSKSKVEVTSAVTTVSSEQLEQLSPTLSIDNMLQGVAPGVQVTGANGKPGQTAYVRVRGIGSINASSAPLYIIDGVVAPDLNSLNPNDIESVSVLKDAATSSIYGSRAANGVVLIKTKGGTKREAVITVSTRYGWGEKIKDNFKMMNTAQKLQFEREMHALGVNESTVGGNLANQSEYNYYLSLDHDWQDDLLKQAIVSSNSVSVSGGSDDLQYYLGVAQDKNTGIIESLDGFERLSARINVTYQAKKWLEISTNASVARTSSDEPRDRNNAQNPFRAMYDYNPYETKYQVDENGNTIYDENGNPEWNLTSAGYSISEALITNPETRYHTYFIGGLNLKATLYKGLTNTFKIGGNLDNYRRESFSQPNSILQGIVGEAGSYGSKIDNGYYNFDYTVTDLLSYNFLLGEKHDITATALFEFNKATYQDYYLRSIGFVSDNLSVQSIAATPTDADTDRSISTLLSYGGFLDYNYDDKYIVTGSLRRDGSSVFGLNNQYGVFWSASAGWNITSEEFLSDNNIINNLKLRASAGTSGNRGGFGAYSWRPQIAIGSFNNTSYAFPGTSGNPNLSFEKNFIWDIGVEFTMLNNRINGVIDYYKRTTSDLLLNRPLMSLGGEPGGSIIDNVGEMENSGLEIQLSGDIIRTPDLRVTLGGNIAFVDNNVTKLVPTAEYPNGAPISRGETRIEVGEEVTTFYLVRYAGVNPANGEPLYYDVDGNVTNQYSGDDAVLLSGKSTLAKFDGGINLNVEYKGLYLTGNLYFKAGHYIMNYMQSNMISDGLDVTANQRVDAFNYWRQPGDTNVLPSPLYANEAQQASDRWLQKGDYMRLRNLTLGYNVPKKWTDKIYLQGLRVYVQGQNLWTWAKEFKGDPEVGIGSGETTNAVFGAYNLYSYPQTQSISLGVDIKI